MGIRALLVTSGAYVSSQKAGGWAACLLTDQLFIRPRWLSGKAYDTSINRMELAALIDGLLYMDENESAQTLYLSIRGEFVRNAIFCGWAKGWRNRSWKSASGKEIEDRDLWEPLLELLDKKERAGISVRECDYPSADEQAVIQDAPVQAMRNATSLAAMTAYRSGEDLKNNFPDAPKSIRRLPARFTAKVPTPAPAPVNHGVPRCKLFYASLDGTSRSEVPNELNQMQERINAFMSQKKQNGATDFQMSMSCLDGVLVYSVSWIE